MRLSELVIRIVSWTPWLFRPLVWIVFQVYPYRIAEPSKLWHRLKYMLGIRTSRRIHLSDGFIIKADPFDGPGRILWKIGPTEPETIELFKRIVRPGMVFVDAGAYVGQFSLFASRLVGSAGQVHAFEPTPAVFRQLQWNMRNNGCDNVVCNQLALSDSQSKHNLYFYPGSLDMNSLRPPGTSIGRKQVIGRIPVEVETLDHYCAANRLNHVDCMKIDVEGNELAVLRGGQVLLGRNKTVVVVEISQFQQGFGYHGKDIAHYLAGMGYYLYRLGHTPLTPYTPQAEDFCNRDPFYHFNVLAVHGDALGIYRLNGVIL